MATIGRGKAIAYMGRHPQITGITAWLAWLIVHIAYLIGFRNRFSVMLQWFFHYLTGARRARLIYRSIEEETLPTS